MRYKKEEVVDSIDSGNINRYFDIIRKEFRSYEKIKELEWRIRKLEHDYEELCSSREPEPTRTSTSNHEYSIE